MKVSENTASSLSDPVSHSIFKEISPRLLWRISSNDPSVLTLNLKIPLQTPKGGLFPSLQLVRFLDVLGYVFKHKSTLPVKSNLDSVYPSMIDLVEDGLC